MSKLLRLGLLLLVSGPLAYGRSPCALGGKICVGDEAVNSDRELVRVIGIYNEREIAIQYSDGHIKAARGDQLGVCRGCNSKFCVGDEAVANDVMVTITSIYLGNDTDVSVSPDGKMHHFEKDVFVAMKRPNCSGEYSRRPVCQ